MNDTFAAAMAVQLSELTAVPVPALGEPGYGRDLDCVSDCSDDFREIGPDTPLIIIQALARRYQTPNGSLIEDRDYGCDLCGSLHVGMTQAELRKLHTAAVGEALKDERIETASIRISFKSETNTLTLAALITPRDPRLEPFPMVLTITEAAVLISE